jgi:hypothetical protein
MTSEQILNIESSHPNFAMIYIDQDGSLQVETSPLLAGHGGAIFTADVADRFMETVISSSQSGEWSALARLHLVRTNYSRYSQGNNSLPLSYGILSRKLNGRPPAAILNPST